MAQLVSESALPLGNNINVSAQIGDELWCSCHTVTADGFQVVGEPQLIGIISGFTDINNTTYVEFNHSIVGVGGETRLLILQSCQTIFLSFKKDCNANISSLLGYYAEATFINDDHQNHNELFGVNAQVAISSK